LLSGKNKILKIMLMNFSKYVMHTILVKMDNINIYRYTGICLMT